MAPASAGAVLLGCIHRVPRASCYFFPVILLDLDGTITDPAPGMLRSLRHAFETLGHPCPDPDRLRACIGPPLQQSFAQILETEDPERIAAAVEAYRVYYRDRGLTEATVCTGIPDLLSVLADRGWPLRLATSKPWIFAERVLRHFGLRDRFEAVHGAELSGEFSDKAELLSFVVPSLDLDPAGVWMIGDRMHDVRAGRALGLHTAGVLWGYGDRAELEGAGAEHVVGSPAELLDLVGSPRDCVA